MALRVTDLVVNLQPESRASAGQCVANCAKFSCMTANFCPTASAGFGEADSLMPQLEALREQLRAAL